MYSILALGPNINIVERDLDFFDAIHKAIYLKEKNKQKDIKHLSIYNDEDKIVVNFKVLD